VTCNCTELIAAAEKKFYAASPCSLVSDFEERTGKIWLDRI